MDEKKWHIKQPLNGKKSISAGAAAERGGFTETMKPYMKLDGYGNTVIRNIYFDTGNFRLIRRSLEQPSYKEKLRIRSYQTVMVSTPAAALTAPENNPGQMDGGRIQAHNGSETPARCYLPDRSFIRQNGYRKEDRLNEIWVDCIDSSLSAGKATSFAAGRSKKE